MNPISKSDILKNTEIILETIRVFSSVDIVKCMDYLDEVVALQALATETLASATYLYLEAVDDELNRQALLMKEDRIAPSIKKMRADAKCREYKYLLTMCERNASIISHTIDAVRTKISYYKIELNNNKQL